MYNSGNNLTGQVIMNIVMTVKAKAKATGTGTAGTWLKLSVL